jgi:hypothetical protein
MLFISLVIAKSSVAKKLSRLPVTNLTSDSTVCEEIETPADAGQRLKRLLAQAMFTLVGIRPL